MYFRLMSYSVLGIYSALLNLHDRSTEMRLHRRRVAQPLILCVDDDPTQLHLRKKVLEQNGFNVLCVTNVADAIATFRETPICCTIADHMLQGENGLELARKLKGIKHDVPIILYSGAMPANLQNIDVYINKDEPTTGFLRIVREVVERFCS